MKIDLYTKIVLTIIAVWSPQGLLKGTLMFAFWQFKTQGPLRETLLGHEMTFFKF